MDLHRRQKSFFIWAVVLFTVFLVWSISITPSGQQPANLSYSKALALLADASERQIPVEITIRRDKWTITLKDQVYKTTAPPLRRGIKKAVRRQKYRAYLLRGERIIYLGDPACILAPNGSNLYYTYLRVSVYSE